MWKLVVFKIYVKIDKLYCDIDGTKLSSVKAYLLHCQLSLLTEVVVLSLLQETAILNFLINR